MSFHDPIRQSKYLRQTLSQDKKPVGFFISAGCPLSVAMPDGQWPLIPDVAGLTKYVAQEILKETDVLEGKARCLSDCYKALIEEIEKTEKSQPNIEDILSFVRGMKQIAKGASDVRGFSEEELSDLETSICQKIAVKLEVTLPNTKTPYHQLARWISNIERSTPIEIFTTNYDLLLEEAFESLKVPYFEGFVGAKRPFFDLRAVEDSLIPKHWTRLWKIHGSINWYLNGENEVYRSNAPNLKDAYIIHPSHFKIRSKPKDALLGFNR